MKRKVSIVMVLLVLIIAGVFTWSAFNISRQREMRVFPKAERIDLGNALVVFYSLTGSAKEIANRISDMTGGTLFEIETEKSYPASPMLYVSVWRELKSGNLPVLKKVPGNYSSFDVVFVGSPVWFSSLPAPMRSFLSQSDFQGKKVIPFSTQGGDRTNYSTLFEKEAHNAEIGKGMIFSRALRKDISLVDIKIAEWLKELKNEAAAKVDQQ
jgi:flavodoxin